MFNFLFCNIPFLCCRCGETLKDGQRVYREYDSSDEIYCKECSYSVIYDTSNEYIYLNGAPRAIINDIYYDDLDDGYYEIKNINEYLIIYRFRYLRNNIFEFSDECDDDSIILEADYPNYNVYVPKRSKFLKTYNCSKLRNWGEDIFDNFNIFVSETDEKKIDMEYYKREEFDKYSLKEYIETLKNKEKLVMADDPKRIPRVFDKKLSKEFLSYCQKRIIGQDSELQKAVYMVIDFANRSKERNFKGADNWLLTAPSGSGKTEFYRTVRDFFKEKNIDIPVLLYDLSQITPSGYKGSDPDDIINLIASRSNDGKCIFFLDESDKKFIPDICGSGGDFNASAQSCLLSMIEGQQFTKIIEVNENGSMVKKKVVIDTADTMFVFLGAFQFIRDDRKNEQNNSKIGFNRENGDGLKAEKDPVYDKITIDEMIKYGLTEQLAGRISQVINFRRISQKDMKMLIKTKVNDIAEKNRINVNINDSAVNDFMDIAYTPLGVRAVINKINELVSDVIARYYFDDSFDTRARTVLITSSKLAVMMPQNK